MKFKRHIADRCDLIQGDSVKSKRLVYRIEKNIGNGTFGDIFKVKGADGCDYALKLLHLWDVAPDIREQLLERFDMEYETGQIRSKYLVQAFDHGIIKGNPYIVMEFCPNGDVLQMMEKSGADLLKIGRHVLYGLKDLHICGKVHRDLKPENVLVKADGTIALTDFGISGDRNKRLTERNILGNPTQIFGTYAYMPPEQVRPKRGDVTVLPTTDIFSYGVMMYQLITNKLPFGRLEDENDLAIYLKRGREGDWNRSLLRNITPHECFNSIIEGCLIPNYKQRLQNVDEVLELLPANTRTTYETNLDGNYQTEIVKGLQLKVMQGEDHGMIYQLNAMLKGRRKVLTVGRFNSDEDNNIQITETRSSYISRRHCTLEWKADDRVWFIRDGQKAPAEDESWKASTNGTYVNSSDVSTSGMYFYPGDIITIGDTKFRAEGY
jgi:serine/threonine protein kinase